MSRRWRQTDRVKKQPRIAGFGLIFLWVALCHYDFIRFTILCDFIRFIRFYTIYTIYNFIPLRFYGWLYAITIDLNELVLSSSVFRSASRVPWGTRLWPGINAMLGYFNILSSYSSFTCSCSSWPYSSTSSPSLSSFSALSSLSALSSSSSISSSSCICTLYHQTLRSATTARSEFLSICDMDLVSR